jgi:hypothetical protein
MVMGWSRRGRRRDRLILMCQLSAWVLAKIAKDYRIRCIQPPWASFRRNRFGDFINRCAGEVRNLHERSSTRLLAARNVLNQCGTTKDAPQHLAFNIRTCHSRFSPSAFIVCQPSAGPVGDPIVGLRLGLKCANLFAAPVKPRDVGEPDLFTLKVLWFDGRNVIPLTRHSTHSQQKINNNAKAYSLGNDNSLFFERNER